LKCGDAGSPLAPPALTARARTRGPNSTTATKLLPFVPYQRLVGGGLSKPKAGSDPHRLEANGTGVLGAWSLKASGLSEGSRCSRLTSPHGTCQRPKSRCSCAIAVLSA